MILISPNLMDIYVAIICLNLFFQKQRGVPNEQVEFQDFIEKQKAYYKEIDEFELKEEEVESVDE